MEFWTEIRNSIFDKLAAIHYYNAYNFKRITD